MNVYLTLFYSNERKMQTMDQNICLTVQLILKDILFELKAGGEQSRRLPNQTGFYSSFKITPLSAVTVAAVFIQ